MFLLSPLPQVLNGSERFCFSSVFFSPTNSLLSVVCLPGVKIFFRVSVFILVCLPIVSKPEQVYDYEKEAICWVY